ncbi:hypothetical protein D917_10117 [Trichinella nativa]|uniref:Uncharacterized protein n=1 Tax=Trichinella nativa TaxID=6335 RepID=A0A1Y3ECY8_9BILA|nr:hypothetical protein D917_10117 [Trichinella nativa]
MLADVGIACSVNDFQGKLNVHPNEKIREHLAGNLSVFAMTTMEFRLFQAVLLSVNVRGELKLNQIKCNAFSTVYRKKQQNFIIIFCFLNFLLSNLFDDVSWLNFETFVCISGSSGNNRIIVDHLMNRNPYERQQC